MAAKLKADAICNINQLNDDCLEEIFKNLPLQTAVQARGVCKRWKAVVEEKICRPKKSLMLFNSFYNILRYGYFLEHSNYSIFENDSDYRYDESKDLVMPGEINMNKCQFLLALFPRVKILVLFHTKFGITGDLVSLITGWNSTLQSLIMVHSHRSTDLAKAFASIDLLSLPQLKRLTVMGDSKYLLKTEIKMPNTIGRVEDFSIGQYTGDIGPVLKQTGPNIHKLRLDSVKFPLKTLENWIFAKPYLKNNLTHLSINSKTSMGLSQRIWQFICTNFQALTYLDITPPPKNNIVDLIPYLSKLKNLTELRLRKPAESRYLTTIKKNQLKLAYNPLNSVKALHVYQEIEEKQIPLMVRLFPNVKELAFNDQLSCVAVVKSPRKCICSKCLKKDSLKKQLYNRFKKLRSVNFAIPTTNDTIERGRFKVSYAKMLKTKPNYDAKNMSGDDFWSSMWWDPFTDNPNEDNGYEQTVEDQQYNFQEDYYYVEGNRRVNGFWTSSRNPGFHPNYEDEGFNFEDLRRMFPDVPHLHFKF